MTDPFLLLGTTQTGKPLSISGTAFAQHKHLVGISGSGKSSYLAWISLSLLRQGIPFSLIDPHADLARLLLAYLLEGDFFADPRFTNRLWYVQFNRTDRALPFNILKQPYSPHTIAANVLETFHRALPATVATTNIDNILLAAIVALCEGGKPLTDLPRLLLELDFRNRLLAHITDPLIMQFFQSKFADKTSASFIDSTLRRSFLLTFSPALRRTLGQTENKLNFREMIDTGISVIFNLGGLDEFTQRFLGCLLTVGFEQAFLSRAGLSPAKRLPYHLIIDEFPLFSSASERSFTHILEQTRKYNGTLYLSHQTFHQLSSEIAGSLQNAISILLQLGYEDSQWAASRFYRKTDEEPSFWDMLLGQEPEPNPFNRIQTMQEAKQLFETLERQQAIVRIGNSPRLIKTPTLPKPTVSEAAIRGIEETYANLLLSPVVTRTAGAQEMGEVPVQPEPGQTRPEKKVNASPPAPAKTRARRRIE